MIARLQALLSPARKCSLTHNHFIAVIAISLAIAAASRPALAEDCSIPSGKWIEERSKFCLQDPGWFDVGAGVVILQNAGVSHQNGIGNMVTLRAYPTGRWYAPLKFPSQASDNLVDAKLSVAKDAKTKAVASKLAADQAASKAATSKAPHDEAAAMQAARVAATDQAEADKASVDIALSMQTALNDFGNNYAVAELETYSHVAHRFSFFLGRSVGGFDSNVVNGDINAFGIAFDIAPQFSVVWGRAYFNLPTQTGVANSSKSGTVFGVQINLNAFKAMRGLTGSL